MNRKINRRFVVKHSLAVAALLAMGATSAMAQA